MSIQERTEPFRVLVCDGCGITCGEEPEAEGILRIFDPDVDAWDYDYPGDLGWASGSDRDYCSRCASGPAKPGWWKS